MLFIRHNTIYQSINHVLQLEKIKTTLISPIHTFFYTCTYRQGRSYFLPEEICRKDISTASKYCTDFKRPSANFQYAESKAILLRSRIFCTVKMSPLFAPEESAIR